ncbi:hypothetical protein [Pararhizobium sp. DWP1-1-3]|uniref:hypothetical protein n=1 Tax=Pararhizobium sp. DWP1-1-3 TaxID=2804652 RepID=UPI003CE6D65A
MKKSLQRTWITDILEAVPSVVFLALWRSGFDMETSGWTGALLAAAQLLGFYRFGVFSNPIMLGINLHLLIITPLIMVSFAIGAREFSDALVVHSYRGVLVTVFVVGCVLTLMSRRGFVGIDDVPKRSFWKTSGVLLAASALAIVWAFAYTGAVVLSVAVPMIGLFALRRFLIANILDNENRIGGIALAGGVSAFLAGRDQAGEI